MILTENVLVDELISMIIGEGGSGLEGSYGIREGEEEEFELEMRSRSVERRDDCISSSSSRNFSSASDSMILPSPFASVLK